MKQNYFIYGDFDSRDKLLITEVSDFLPNQKVTLQDFNNGSRITDISYGSQTIKINASFQERNSLFKGFKTVRDFRRYLVKYLASDEVRPLYLSQDKDVYYRAIYDGSASTIKQEPGFDYVEVELTFIIPDGVKHSVEEKQFGSDGDYVEVKNNGDRAVNADVEIEFPSDCAYVGLTLDDSVVQLGTVEEMDVKQEKSTVIFSDTMEKDVDKHWKKNIAKSAQDTTTQLIGKMGQSAMKYGQAVIDFGKPKSDGDTGDKVWHGASLSRYLNDEINNFEIKARVRFNDAEDSYTIFNTSDVKYTVKKSDTLDAIAKKYKVDKKYLKSWNEIKSEKNFGKNYVGKSIIVGKKDQAKEVNMDKASEMQYYYAGANDTVKHAASVSKVSEENFRSWNKLKYNQDNLKEGHPYIIKKGSSKTAFKNGRTEFQAVDAGNNIIAGIRLKDNTEGYNEISLSFYVGDKVLFNTKVNRKYLDLYAELRIKKLNNKLTFTMQAINEDTGEIYLEGKKKHRAEFVRTYTNEDVAMLSLKRVDYLGLCYRNIYQESRAIYQSFTHCKVTKLPQSAQDYEVFTFDKGTKLLLKDNIPYINGVKDLNFMAIGSDNLKVPPGISRINYTYPQNATQPLVTVKIREEYY